MSRYDAQSAVGGSSFAVDLVAAADAARQKDVPPPPPSPAPSPRRRRRPAVDPWTRVAFNSKTPRWVRSAARAFADERDLDLQDLHAAALVAFMAAQGFDVAAYAPDLAVSPAPEKESDLAELLDEVAPDVMHPADEA